MKKILARKFMAKILITDDSLLQRMNIKRILLSEGHEIEEAVDGVDCLHKLSENSYDLISLDLLMPNKGGIEVLAELKTQAELEGKIIPPVIVLSADIQTSVREEIESYGVSDFLNKPVNKDPFLVAVNKVLDAA